MNVYKFSKVFLPMVVVLTLSGSNSLYGQPFELVSFTVDGGGGVSTAGSFEMAGLIGQPDAGAQSSGGSFTLDGGFDAPDPVLLGDVNGDGAVNLLDVAPFADAISSGTFIPEADVNQDGLVNLLDVGPFVAVLSGA